MQIRPTLRNALFSAVTMFAFMAAGAEAREATITLKDGTKVTGDVIGEDPQMITLMIAGIRTPVARERIQDVAYAQTLTEQYRERRARIADDNQDERYKLIRWLIDSKSWDQAQSELNDYQKKFPDDDRSKLLARIIDGRKKIDAGGDEKTDKPKAATTKSDKPDKTVDKPEKEKIDTLELLAKRLNEDQINMIRVYEIDPDSKPAVYISREAIDELFKGYSDNPSVPKGKDKQDKFRGLQGYDQMKVFFAARARDLYPKIKVKSDPEVIKVFREKVHQNYVLNYCGTNECHGGPNAGAFFVFNREPSNVEPSVYTNFYVLHEYQAGKGYMLDTENPDSSYLLQYGLPTAAAKFPHPPVKNWRPSFLNSSDTRYQIIHKWISSFPKAKNDYGIQWRSPTFAPAAAPTTAPATE